MKSFITLSWKCPYRLPPYQCLQVLQCLSGGWALEQLEVSQAAGRMELCGIMVGVEGIHFMGENCTQVGGELTPVLLRKLLLGGGLMLNHIWEDFSCLSCLHACHQAFKIFQFCRLFWSWNNTETAFSVQHSSVLNNLLGIYYWPVDCPVYLVQSLG